MFTDPQSITVNAVAQSMPKIKIGSSDATYRTADEVFQMRISHQPTKSRTRRMVRIDQTLIAADPLTSTNSSQSAAVYLVIDEPKFGFTDAQLDYLVDALVLWLTPANIAKVLGSET